MTRSLFIRLCVVGLVVIAAALLMLEVGHMAIDLLFALVLIGGAVLGLVIAKLILPRLGDAVGGSLYLPASETSVEIASDDQTDPAALLLEQGDYEGALRHYEEALLAHPDDTRLVFEITQVCVAHLNDPGRAVSFLDQQLATGTRDSDGLAFLLFRKVEILVQCREQHSAAREVLESIVQRFPDTPHSARAHHLMHQIT